MRGEGGDGRGGRATPRRVVVVHDIADPEWRWIAPDLAGEAEFEFHRAPLAPRSLGRRLKTLAVTLKAVRAARDADLLISVGPGLASSVAIARLALGVRTPHLAQAFNFDRLPRGAARLRMRLLFRTVDRLIISSRMERALYARHFGLDPARLDVLLWGEKERPAGDLPPAERGYACAIGGNSRDYATLLRAAARRPDIAFRLVVRPKSLSGLAVPANVTALVNVPMAEAMAVLRGARLMVLPLKGSDTPCGHVTIVAGFFAATPMIVTRSTGIEDYIADGETGLLVEVGSVDSLLAAIDRLWRRPAEGARIAALARDFAMEQCTEHGYVRLVREMLGLA